MVRAADQGSAGEAVVSAAAAAAAKEARLDDTLRALSDPARRGVVDLLRRQPQRAGELARALSMTPPALSRHLRVLRKSGLVEETSEPDDARVRVYCLRRERFTELAGWLTELDAFWTEQLGAFAAHVKTTAKTTTRRSGAR